MRRVIYAWNYVEWGGAQIHFLALIKEARKEFETIVVLPDGTDTQFLGFLDAEGVRYVDFRGSVDLKLKRTVWEKLARHWTRIKSEYAMLRAIEGVGFKNSIIHTDISPGQSLLSLAWLLMRAPVFLTLHNALPPVPRWRWTLWKIKFGIVSGFKNLHVFCTNEHAARYFGRLFGKRVSDDIKITYDSIDPVAIDEARSAPFDRGETLRRSHIPADKFVVLAVGQFVDRKGRWTFLDAATRVRAVTDRIVFVWLSPFLPDAVDTKKIVSCGLGDSFQIIRSDDVGTSRQSILQFFRIGDVFALPSFIEGVPISLLEAMAMGLPCVSTNVYGIPEAIVHEKTGLLVEAGDPDALARAILNVHSHPEMAAILATSARELAMTKFDERSAARIAVAAYKSAYSEA